MLGSPLGGARRTRWPAMSRPDPDTENRTGRCERPIQNHRLRIREMNAIITTADLIVEADEPRITDTKLAEVLGYAKPTKIRDLIKRHLAELSAYGTVPQVGAPYQSGNGAEKETFEFRLNEAQSLLIAMKSGTAKAVEARRQLIEVFLA